MKNKLCISIGIVSIITSQVFAGSATWKRNPDTGIWASASNWTPASFPNGPDDIATFGGSNFPYAFAYQDIEVNSIVFEPGASAFKITIGNVITGAPLSLMISGAGVINNSGVTQNLVARNVGSLIFSNSAALGEQIVFTNEGAGPMSADIGMIAFTDTADAGNAIFNCNPATGSSGGSLTLFTGESTAASATFVANGASSNTINPEPVIEFDQHATAAEAIFTINGGTAAGAPGARLNFNGGTAENATLIANAGTNGGRAGGINFIGESRGGKARVELSGGTLDIQSHQAPGVIIGSLEGSGTVFLGNNQLTVGSSGLSTRFEGVIEGRGSLAKGGVGRLSLTAANRYAGGTSIELGELGIENANGSATGSGPVSVHGGILSGNGRIDGAVTIGTGSSPRAALSPGARPASAATLRIRNALTFNGDATYDFTLNSTNVEGDKVIADGVTINTGATLEAQDFGAGILPVGTSFTAISNGAGTAIAGTFVNLADGGTIVIGSNTFQANYEGGDGNDLTLTVIQ